MRSDILLADCESEELEELVLGLEDTTKLKFVIENKICNGGRSKRENAWRYLVYAVFPIKYIVKRKNYNYIICWQQFFALFFAFYCEILHLEKENFLMACNFTYKEKKGISGKIYRKFMQKSVQSIYLDKIHVLSYGYAEEVAEQFGIPINKFIISPFGLPDTYAQWRSSTVEYKKYSLAIGRSNRDFDFLVNAWKLMPESELLIIVSDTFKPKAEMLKNVIHRKDIVGDAQFPYIANCELMIIPIDDGKICSGDTVLLKAMSYHKPLVVTLPSTLAEMYVEDGYNGLVVEKDIKKFANRVSALLRDESKMHELGANARLTYEMRFSRLSMGKNIGEFIR